LAQFIIRTLPNIITGSGFQASGVIPILLDITVFLAQLAGFFSVLVIIWGGYQYFLGSLPGGKADAMKTIQAGVTGLIVVLLAQPIAGLVEGIFQPDGAKLNLQSGGLTDFIYQFVTRLFIPAASVITVALLVWGGLQYITARGDSGQVKNAQQTLRNAIIGLIVVLLAVTITAFVTYITTNTGFLDTTRTTQR
jgi:TRAP-type C4-dicarboxylate transport system permease small subunit